MADDGPREACKTYIEQTKLLVALASAFIVAPAALVPWIAGKERIPFDPPEAAVHLLFAAELSFIVSVLMGYVVLATIAGFQQLNKFDVNRSATKWSSRLQIVAYLVGLFIFVRFLRLFF
jgi:hypothetical protein